MVVTRARFWFSKKAEIMRRGVPQAKELALAGAAANPASNVASSSHVNISLKTLQHDVVYARGHECPWQHSTRTNAARSASYNMQVVAAETTDNSLTYQGIAGPIHKQTDRVLMD